MATATIDDPKKTNDDSDTALAKKIDDKLEVLRQEEDASAAELESDKTTVESETSDTTPAGEVRDEGDGEDGAGQKEQTDGRTQDSVDDKSHDAEKASDDQVQEYGAELLKRADDFGINEQMAKKLGTPAELIAVISRIEEQEITRAVGGEKSAAPIATDPAKTEVEKETVSEQKKAATEAPSGKFDLVIDADEVGEKTAEQLKAMNDHYAARLEALEQRSASGVEEQEKDRVTKWANAYQPHFDKLARPDLFGTGSTLTMDQNSEEFKNRLALMQFGERYTANLQRFSGDLPDDDVLFGQMFDSLHPGQHERRTAEKIGATLRDRQDTVVPSPSGAVTPQAQSGKKDDGSSVSFDARYKELQNAGDLD